MGETSTSLLRNRSYLLLLIIVFFMHLASFLIIPVFPIFLQKVRALSIGQVGIILGIGSVTYQAGSLIGGLLSDRFGRRSVMVTGALTQATAMIGYSFSETYLMFLLFSAINGLGVGLLAPTLKAMIVDLVGRMQRTAAFSWRGIAAHSGIIIAGLTITWLTVTNRQPFLYAAAVFVVLAVVTYFSLPYDRCLGENCQKTPFREYMNILKHKSFLFFSFITLLIWAFYAQFALVMPLRGEYVLHSATLIGLIWTINSASVVLLQGPISRYLLERINPYLSLVAGTFMLGAGLFGLGWAEHFYTLSASAILFIIGEMLFMPVLDSLVGHFAKEDWLGAYFGVANFVSGFGSAIGTAVGGTMIERLGGVSSRTPWFAYGLATILLVTLLGLFASYAMSRHNRSNSDETNTSRKEKEGAN